MTHQEYLDLVAELIGHARMYYKFGSPTIPDAEWDMLYYDLGVYETEHPNMVVPNSPYGKVGFAMFGEGGTHKHNPPMLSLKNAMTKEIAISNILAYRIASTSNLFMELKADGIACRLVYQGGKLVQALTRGDGIAGEDITDRFIHVINNVPPECKEFNQVDGEIVLKYDQFDIINDLRELNRQPRFKNTRNAVTGIFQAKDNSPIDQRRLSFIAYGCDNATGDKSWTQNRKTLTDIGFEVVPGQKLGDDFLKVEASYVAARDHLPWAIDGLVVKVDSLSERQKMGETSESPRWAFSYKFAPMIKWTMITGTEFTVGRTGQITGMVHFTPVDLGVIVSKSSIDSYPRWKDLNIGIGDKAWVSRRADVRPYIETTEETKNSRPVPFTATCPGCGGLVKVLGKKVFCVNDNCTGRRTQAITYAFGKECLNIANFSEAAASVVAGVGYRLFTKMYRVSAADLVSKGMISSVAVRLVEAIEKSRDTNMYQIIMALGVPSVGTSVSKEIANWIMSNKGNTIEALVETMSNENTVSHLPIGGAIRLRIIDEMTKESYKDNLDNLPYCGFRLLEAGPLVGKNYCLTGAFINNSRSMITQWLKELGANIQSNVSKTTDALITDTKEAAPWESTSKKEATAEKLGVVRMTSQQAVEMIGKLSSK